MYEKIINALQAQIEINKEEGELINCIISNLKCHSNSIDTLIEIIINLQDEVVKLKKEVKELQKH